MGFTLLNVLSLSSHARRLAILCVAFCTFSLISASLAIPALLSASLSLQADLQLETDFCHVRLRNFWTELNEASVRAKRAPQEVRGVKDGDTVQKTEEEPNLYGIKNDGNQTI